ncbi:MAG: hypothetical protein ACRC33_31600 [Gemmataceae bacterium]
MSADRTVVLRRAAAARHLDRLLGPADDAGSDEVADGLEQAFAGLAHGFRRLRAENRLLRDENDRLRAGLRECVEACAGYLGPLLDDADHDRARLALGDARRLLSPPE